MLLAMHSCRLMKHMAHVSPNSPSAIFATRAAAIRSKLTVSEVETSSGENSTSWSVSEAAAAAINLRLLAGRSSNGEATEAIEHFGRSRECNNPRITYIIGLPV